MESSNVLMESYKEIPVDSRQYPIEFIEANGTIVLEVNEQNTIIGITEKTSNEIIETLSNYHTITTLFVKLSQTELSSWLSRQLGDTQDTKNLSNIETQDNTQLLDKLANDAPIINLVNSICIEGIRQGASDIHLEAGAKFARVRYRIDGILKTVRTIESNRFAAVSSRIKIMSNLNILEKRQPQDGRITVSIGNETADLRISIIPVTGGESIVMRVLGKNTIPISLDRLGFSSYQLSLIKSMIKIPHGLILVTGPTGSGKTTTLNAIMTELVSDETKIISIEDPVEFMVDGVNQIQINEQINLGFDVILRRVLRQDPNIIMIGEIRDQSTAELAVRAALTGHLVLSTLHTNDSVSVINRLINMGIPSYLIASVLKGGIAQRLVRKCNTNSTTPNDKYKGRTVISETFRMDTGLENLILDNASTKLLFSYLKSSGMKFLKDDAIEKINLGITTKSEASREILFTSEEIL